ncbi:hypothetical protein BOTBODRAFT_311264 [Botryobasidium botryosum FD-172 SS1]|uniref:Uncharacterized protein n=1 Tax=Botryobasidium botryosum (strain FD-172 SS1) TaxID=930990 RepID=A0A067N9T6_BOTB1|nr:hypothetical protein BOTBODRAFT_311264 [Botryobasidium botryosum FD-172 SS1]
MHLPWACLLMFDTWTINCYPNFQTACKVLSSYPMCLCTLTVPHLSPDVTFNLFFFSFQNSIVTPFIGEVTPLISSSLHSIPPPLQIIIVGCGKCIQLPPLRSLTPPLAAVIIAAKAFWLHPGYTKPAHITAASQHYFQSGTAEHVRMAILEAFKGAPELYDTPESKAALVQVVLKNQMAPDTVM